MNWCIAKTSSLVFSLFNSCLGTCRVTVSTCGWWYSKTLIYRGFRGKALQQGITYQVNLSLQSIHSNRKPQAIAQKRELVIRMLKSGKSSFSVALHFGIGDTTVGNIKKKWAELNRYETTFGSPACQACTPPFFPKRRRRCQIHWRRRIGVESCNLAD